MSDFPSLFSDTPSCTHLIEHDIDVGDAEPIRQRFYRVSQDKQRHLEAEVKYLLDNGLAKPSYSSWASPCILVSKPDGTHRFCTDYRKLNNITKSDSFPLPRVEDCVDQVGSARFVSKFDLLKRILPSSFVISSSGSFSLYNTIWAIFLLCYEFRFTKCSSHISTTYEPRRFRFTGVRGVSR